MARNEIQRRRGSHTAELRARGNRFIVIDNFLPAVDFASVALDFDTIRLNPVRKGMGQTADGPAYRGGDSVQLFREEKNIPRWQCLLKDHTVSGLQLLDGGSFEQAGLTLSLSAWGYPSGSRTSWHYETPERVGSFIYFVHREWQLGWGGGLFIADQLALEAADSPELADLNADPILILPRPNRLVLIRSNTKYAVQRIDRSAGYRIRKTWAGFLSKAP
ncbi:2OG-Fe(II) oxygenase [Streptomyces sp. 3211]|uniref:2OG-Fe(II) oxygenase n=1 Tax=Streptomyces sp. 3211 TaxID=1964449 RepID=UPI000D1BDC64|nr:2OG-Fe(II) oxygenase [Streptomyces sp. 3211]